MWQIWVDTGGTFTDCIAVDPSGELQRAKVLSSGALRGESTWLGSEKGLVLDLSLELPDDFLRGAKIYPIGSPEAAVEIVAHKGESGRIDVDADLDRVWSKGPDFEIDCGIEAPILAAHAVTGTPLFEELPCISMRLATTRGTNALLERRGTSPVLFVTAGFGDLLRIGNQQRPDLFALEIETVEPLYSSVIEVPERLEASGEVLRALDIDEIADEIAAAVARGARTAAIALMHSYQNPSHEEMLCSYLVASGFEHVSKSSDLAQRIKIVPRAETAVVNAYLSGVIEEYLDQVQANLPAGRLHVLTSAGGLVVADEFQPKDSLLSGPAGGVVGAAKAALGSGYTRSIALDMGGTSTDVSRYDGDFDYAYETSIGGVHLLAPALSIETVAAGGGSICDFDGRQLKVGPQSAGANPGPACYGAGGPLTLTDVNLLLGRLDANGFEIPIDPQAARVSATALLSRVCSATSRATQLEEMLVGLLAIANERMAETIRQISIRKGYDPARFSLVAFGGAGGQHASDLAEILNMSTILVPFDASLLSAVGLGQARIERFAEKQVLGPLSEVSGRLDQWFHELSVQARDELAAEGVDSTLSEIRRRVVSLRVAGQETCLEIEYKGGQGLDEHFYDAYEQEYGYSVRTESIEVESVRLIASTRIREQSESDLDRSSHHAEPSRIQSCFVDAEWQHLDVYDRTLLRPGASLVTPCLVLERHSATLVKKDWTATVDQDLNLLLRHDLAPADSGQEWGRSR